MFVKFSKLKLFSVLVSLLFFTGLTSATGQALEFDGESDFAEASGDLQDWWNDRDTASFSFWIKTEQTEQHTGLLGTSKTSTQVMLFVLNDESSGDIRFYVEDAGGDDWGHRANIDYMNDGDWRHVVFVADSIGSNEGTFFIDGNEVSQTTYDSGPVSLSSMDYPVHLGVFNNYGSPTDFFEGAMDDVRIYNRSLESGEVQELYENRYETVAEEHLAGWWPMNEGEGEETEDNTFRENNVTINGAEWINSGEDIISICDQRGPKDECMVENTHNTSGESINIENIFISESTAILESKEAKTDIFLNNDSTISGSWFGDFNIETSGRTVLKSGAEFKPENKIQISSQNN